MLERIVKISNYLGIHARPAQAIVKISLQYISELTFEKDGVIKDGKNVMDLLYLSLKPNSNVIIRVSGKDESELMDHLCEVLADEETLEGRKPLLSRDERSKLFTSSYFTHSIKSDYVQKAYALVK